MNYYSTNKNAPIADLEKAVVKGLAEDRGLYMPDQSIHFPRSSLTTLLPCRFRISPST